MRYRSLLPLLLVPMLACSARRKNPEPPLPLASSSANSGNDTREEDFKTSEFSRLKASHKTVLTHREPAPQECDVSSPPPNVKTVFYRSEGRDLRAWYAEPDDRKPGERRGAVAMFHGGYGFDESDWANTTPFLDAGYVVFAPMLRAECGNPGNFEVAYGEVDDGLAAVAWLRAQPSVDPQRVFAIGHSAGGIVVAFVSMYPNSGLRLAASVGGLYDRPTRDATFDASDPLEALLRSPGRHGASIRIPHIAYVGEEDALARRGADRATKDATKAGRPLTLVPVPGDHFQSIHPAIDDFLLRIAREKSARSMIQSPNRSIAARFTTDGASPGGAGDPRGL